MAGLLLLLRRGWQFRTNYQRFILIILIVAVGYTSTNWRAALLGWRHETPGAARCRNN